MPIVSGTVVLPSGEKVRSDRIELGEIRGVGRLSEWEFILPIDRPSATLLNIDGTCRLQLDDGRVDDCFWKGIKTDYVSFQGTGPLAKPNPLRHALRRFLGVGLARGTFGRVGTLRDELEAKEGPSWTGTGLNFGIQNRDQHRHGR